MKRTAALAAAAALFLAAQVPGVAHAHYHDSPYDNIDSTSFAATAYVPFATSVTAQPLTFGMYNPYANLPTDTTSTITVTAPNGVGYVLQVSSGQSPNEDGRRNMVSSAGDLLAYDLYSDADRYQPWMAWDVLQKTGTGWPADTTVYGRIPARQITAAPTHYSDTVTLTVYYDLH